MKVTFNVATWLLLPVVIGACAAAASTTANQCPSPTIQAGLTEFVAFANDFDCFHSWNNAAAQADDDAGDGLHGVGPLRVYWNVSPPASSTAFPVGTIIVKETEETDPTARTVFAMVKRGGGFNSSGANNWEWFSLQNQADGSVLILWRGVVPPADQTYAGQPIGDCNGCHTLASSNDYVWDLALQLANF
jgi:hypothetical protein